VSGPSVPWESRFRSSYAASNDLLLMCIWLFTLHIDIPLVMAGQVRRADVSKVLSFHERQS
jgi:hypothetical protein